MEIDFAAILNGVLSYLLSALEVMQEWTILHPYIVAGGLILICANPEILLTPLRCIARTMLSFLAILSLLIALPFQLLAVCFLWVLGFRRRGVERDSFASRYQSRYYGGYIPPDSTFAHLQSYGAIHHYHHDDILHNAFDEPEEGPTATAVRWFAGLGAALVLLNEWGLLDNPNAVS